MAKLSKRWGKPAFAVTDGKGNIYVNIENHRIYLPAAKFSSLPSSTPQGSNSRPTMIKDSFVVLVVGR